MTAPTIQIETETENEAALARLEMATLAGGETDRKGKHGVEHAHGGEFHSHGEEQKH